MKIIKFTVLHPAGTNADITKDEGQIPYTLTHMKYVEGTIVSCHIDHDCANISNVPGLIVKHYPLIINHAITGVIYLLANSRKIDWLNVYFAGRQAYIWMRIYKFLNRKGHIYLKLDMDFRGCDLYDSNNNERKIFYKNTEIADVISVESLAVKKRIQKYSKKDLLLIEDGIAKPEFESPIVPPVRENLFVTVGRLGTYQKATDLLLEAFQKSSKYHDWNLKLIGNIESNFIVKIQEFYNKYPEMKQRVTFTGPINDRKTLYTEYYKAKVFILPSRWESYGISAAEALSCGCRLILSDSIPPATEMTDYGKYGEIVKSENIDYFAKAMIDATKKQYPQSGIEDMINYANTQFSWERICNNLFIEMRRLSDERN